MSRLVMYSLDWCKHLVRINFYHKYPGTSRGSRLDVAGFDRTRFHSPTRDEFEGSGALSLKRENDDFLVILISCI